MNKVIPVILFIVSVAALTAVVIYYKQQVTQISKTLESERYSRLVAEEKVINSVSKITQLQNDLKELLGEIERMARE